MFYSSRPFQSRCVRYGQHPPTSSVTVAGDLRGRWKLWLSTWNIDAAASPPPCKTVMYFVEDTLVLAQMMLLMSVASYSAFFTTDRSARCRERDIRHTYAVQVQRVSPSLFCVPHAEYVSVYHILLRTAWQGDRAAISSINPSRTVGWPWQSNSLISSAHGRFDVKSYLSDDFNVVPIDQSICLCRNS